MNTPKMQTIYDARLEAQAEVVESASALNVAVTKAMRLGVSCRMQFLQAAKGRSSSGLIQSTDFKVDAGDDNG